ncbi:MAG: hypothetical protein IPK27_07400 [Rhodanobacteraceae bacterium]|nr:hypothetical protein [Rhodanobacteraceae bacterium]
MEAKNGNTVEEIHQIYTKLTELEPENLDWEKAARALEPEIQKIRDVRNAEAMAQAEAESNARLARRFSDCNVGFFGPSVRINGLGRAFWEYTLPQLGTTDLSGLVYHLADEAYSIAKACETAKQLQVTVRVTGLVDRFGASAPDVTATIDIDLVEARKFAGSAYYTQDDAVGAYLSVLISTSRIARFVDD